MKTPVTPSNDDLLTEAFRQVTNPDDAPAPAAESQTLEGLDKSRRPSPRTVCEACPNSVWFASPVEVRCYCRVMYLVTWSSKDPQQITACDGLYIGQGD